MRGIRWSLAARQDLREIRAYIARDSRVYAKRLVDRIQKATEGIRLFPEAGSHVAEWGREDVREIFVGSYRIIYRIRADIEIIAVIHSCPASVWRLTHPRRTCVGLCRTPSPPWLC